jgi:hypothetical protein
VKTQKKVKDLEVGDVIYLLDDADKATPKTATITTKKITRAIRYEGGAAAYDLEYRLSNGTREIIWAGANDVATVRS